MENRRVSAAIHFVFLWLIQEVRGRQLTRPQLSWSRALGGTWHARPSRHVQPERNYRKITMLLSPYRRGTCLRRDTRGRETCRVTQALGKKG